MRAEDIIDDAKAVLAERAAGRDQPDGERSLEKQAAAFNAITGHNLSERDCAIFMVTLKAVRACTTPRGQPDDYRDMVGYSGLGGEAASK